MKDTKDQGASWKLPQRFTAHPKNTEIVRYLHESSPSAHSDVTSEMILAAQGLHNVHSFAPAPQSYSCEVLHTADGVIFCASVGQSTLLIRIPPNKHIKPLDHLSRPFPPLGSDWVAVGAFQSDIPLAEWRRSLKEIIKAALNSAV